jgi:hypothetical protein
LFSKRAELKDNTFYNIQIQKNKRNNHIYLIAQNESTNVTNDDYYIDLPKNQASSVKRIFANDYSSMVDSISIHDEKLVLLYPTYTDTSRNLDEKLYKTEDKSIESIIQK